MLTVALLVLVLTLPTIAVAHDEDGDHIEDEVEQEMERQLKITTETNTAKVKSEFENQTVENEFQVKLRTDGGVRIDFSFGTEINTTETELEVNVRFRQLIEFVDNNGDGLPNGYENVQTIDLTNKAFSSPTVTQITSTDDETGYKLETHIQGQTYVFQVIVETFPTFAVVNNTLIAPTESKITIAIKDFPYQQNGSLALTAKIESEKEIEEKTNGDEKELEIKSANATGFFSWNNTAQIDGISKQVKSNTATDNGRLVTLAYPNGQNIVHDPKIGITLSPVSSGSGLFGPGLQVYLIVAIVLAALIIGIGTWMLRARKLKPMKP